MVCIQISRGELGRIRVLLPYDPGLIAKIKTIAGRILNSLNSLVVQQKGEAEEGP